MARPPDIDRKEQILQAAERAFAERGFEAASLRRIVREAKVNLATVYYYFGSKEGLMVAVFNRRFDPLRQEHLQRLRQAEQKARSRPPPVQKLLEALIVPPLILATQASTDSSMVRRLIGRMVTEPNPQIQDLLRRQFADVRAAFFQAMQRSLPHVPPVDLHWRMQFVWGALAYILCNPGKIEKMTGGSCNPLDTRVVVAQMLAFFSPAFRAAPVPGTSRANR